MGTRLISAGGSELARIREADGGPIIAVALHAGHAVRPGLAERLWLSDAERLREEDPHTAEMAPDEVTLIEVLRSRFEVDLNRARYRAVYQGPADAWGLTVWDGELPDDEDRVSRNVYDTFYAAAFDELSRVVEYHGRFVVFDLHSYNHRRAGAEAPVADPSANPDVNLGTGRIGDRARWAPVIDAFSSALNAAGFDVRENVKFAGGHFAHWVTDTFPVHGCPLAIEFKKTYMDEWTGEPDAFEVRRRKDALTQAAIAVREALPLIR